MEELRKLKHQLRSKAYSKGGTPQDRKMIAVAGDLLKKKEREEIQKRASHTTMEQQTSKGKTHPQ